MPESKFDPENMSREDLVYAAKLAEQAERYDDMVKNMSQVACKDADLSVEERNLLSVAYKNVIGARRASWRVLTSILNKEETKNAENPKVAHVRDYRTKVEGELDDTCDEILECIKKKLVPKAENTEAKVFYHKMSGDYYRYLAEFKSEDAQTSAANEACRSYEDAQKAAEEPEGGLPPTHPIRLGLALNFSVFYYEILNKPEKACELAKSAFDDAIAELDSLQEDSYKDATLIMQLLRDNLTLWTSDEEQQ